MSIELTGHTEKQNDDTASGGHMNVHPAAGVKLDPDTARQAVILAEIIGKPLAKKNRRR